MNYKKMIIYTVICLIFFWLIIIWGSNLVSNRICLKEALTDFEKYSFKLNPFPKDAVINYNDLNSPLYSHTVNLPFNNPYICHNFCGPKAQCAITGNQCSSDIDCPGCQPPNKSMPKYTTVDISPYDNGGKLTQNQGLNYSNLTTGYNGHKMNFAPAYPGSKSSVLKQSYQGEDRWMKSFNDGLELYNKKRSSHDKYNQGRFQGGLEQWLNKGLNTNENLDFSPNYPTSISMTGLFYQTTPPASNSYSN